MMFGSSFQVPAYVSAQLLGSTLAAGTLRLLFTGSHKQFAGTLPSGSDLQAFVIEFIITFYLMFVICGVATDNRAVSFSSCVGIFFFFWLSSTSVILIKNWALLSEIQIRKKKKLLFIMCDHINHHNKHTQLYSYEEILS